MTAPLTQYQIGWICALPVEVTAAKQMLDEDFGMLESQYIGDPNVYHLGRIGRHFVVIATLPAGQYGVAAAATVAANMMRTFSTSLRVGILVGIGGGIPSDDHDIRLGDIVVSQPLGTCGGVWQYDTGKVISGGTFERTGSLNSPPRCLLTSVANMRAAALGDDSKYPEYVETATKRNARMQKNFGRPDQSTDRLFHACYAHPERTTTCKDCPEEWEVVRDARDDVEPQVFYGIIASGNAVIKDALTRDALRQESGALCFEMEAAGLMLDFPCIVIRGICDYADSHKNEQWQGYAALVAAAYAKELLGHFPVGHLSQEMLAKELCKDIVKEIHQVSQSMEKALEQRENHHRERIEIETTKQQQECHQALKTSTYEQHKNINPDPVKGTCRWLLDNCQYLAWVSSAQNDLLWISADPGCGKSVLAKSLIDNELRETSILVCYFFFKDNDDQNNLVTALCAILHQLFAAQPQLLRHAVPTWQKIGNKIQNEVEELWRILLACASDPVFSNTVCILDALDECRPGDRAFLIGKLGIFYDMGLSSVNGRRKADSARNWLKFLVTSRPYADIKHDFRPSTEKFPHIQVCGEDKNDQISEEINLVIKTRVAQLSSKYELAPNTSIRVEEQLLTMQHRTYLWLHLAIDDLDWMFHNSLRMSDVRAELIPNSVRAAYAKILERVPPDQQSLAKTILRVAVGARRTLTIKEMAIALGLALDFGKSADVPLAKESFLSPIGLDNRIRHLCGLFIFIKGSRVHLIHQTAREFLLREGHEWFLDRGGNEALMAHVCISSLLLYDFHDFDKVSSYIRDQDSDYAKSSIERYKIKPDDLILLPYCLDYWADHLHELPWYAETQLESRIRLLYDTRSSYCILWYQRRNGRVLQDTKSQLCLAAYNGHCNVVRRMVKERRQGTDDNASCVSTALYWASYGGCVKSAMILLDYGASINCKAPARGFQTPIHILPREGQVEAAKLPLDEIFDIDAEAGRYGTALQAASVRGNIEIIQLLLDRGADVDTEAGEYVTALHAASSYGNIEVVKLLLNRGATIDIEAKYFGTALHAASLSGNVKIVQLLLDKGAKIDENAGEYDTALQAAAAIRHIEVVQLLLDRGADVNRRGGVYGTALNAASIEGDIEIVRLLLNKGADINMAAGNYGAALQAASTNSYTSIVQFLLDNGADINAEAGSYGTALQAASANWNTATVQLLLDKGADINAEGGLYGMALHAASAQGHIHNVKLLLDRGANINAEAREKGTALQAASLYGKLEIVRLLLDSGADVNVEAGHYGTALQAASSRGNIEIIQLLLDSGADINIETGEYGTALRAAIHQGNIKIIQLLLDRGANVDTTHYFYGTALQATAGKGSIEILRLLLNKGANINTEAGEWHGPALYAASGAGHIKILEMLLDRGAIINEATGEYGTALQVASVCGNPEVVRVLLDRGADVDIEAGEYNTALQAASARGHIETVRLLLDGGARIDAEAVQSASERGFTEIMRLLQRRANHNTKRKRTQ